jgi:hypothetical protein
VLVNGRSGSEGRLVSQQSLDRLFAAEPASIDVSLNPLAFGLAQGVIGVERSSQEIQRWAGHFEAHESAPEPSGSELSERPAARCREVFGIRAEKPVASVRNYVPPVKRPLYSTPRIWRKRATLTAFISLAVNHTLVGTDHSPIGGLVAVGVILLLKHLMAKFRQS